MSNERDALRKKILSEMTVDYAAALTRNFDRAKGFVRLGKEGKVDVFVKDKVGVREQILLYLVGRVYANEAGLADNDDVGNEELTSELGIPSGSLLPGLKGLRDENKIRQVKRDRKVYHTIPPNQIERTLVAIQKKIGKG